MDFREVVRRRHMVRKFDAKPIPDDVLRRVLEVARHAPSAGFSQGFDFVVLARPDEIDRFLRATDDPTDPEPYPGRDSDRFPAAIVLPFENKRKYLERYSEPDKIEFGMDREESWPVPFWTVDASMAILMILLAAVDEGLGAWYFGITRGEEEVGRELGVPADCKMLGVIALGHPAAGAKPNVARFKARRRAFEDMFHFGRW
jgi:nitroreductase